MIEHLIAREDSLRLGKILAEAFLTSGSELVNEKELRNRVINRVARAPIEEPHFTALIRFPKNEVAPIANRQLGMIETDQKLSAAHFWLVDHS